MKIRSAITISLLFLAICGKAQIRMNEPSFSDYLPLLKNKGYIAYSFNTKKLKGMDVEPVIMEYVKGEEPKSVLNFNVIMTLDKKLIIGLSPFENDSTSNYLFDFGDNRGFSGLLHLKQLDAPGNPYIYETRPFELDAHAEKGKLIPLVLYGSYWYDQNAGACRFCGDNEIKPDLSSDIVKNIPHFFVLGIKIK